MSVAKIFKKVGRPPMHPEGGRGLLYNIYIKLFSHITDAQKMKLEMTNYFSFVSDTLP